MLLICIWKDLESNADRGCFRVAIHFYFVVRNRMEPITKTNTNHHANCPHIPHWICTYVSGQTTEYVC